MTEREHIFLDRIATTIEGDKCDTLSAADINRLYEACLRWRKLETQAGNHVETTIIMRSHHFTGEEPYTGWKGLGLALEQDYDELERLRKAEAERADNG